MSKKITERDEALKNIEAEAAAAGEVLFSPEELAELLGTTTRVVRSWRPRGIGPSYHRLGHKTIRYRESDVRRFIQENRIECSGSVGDTTRRRISLD